MNRKQLIQNYLEFFKSQGHKIIPNESLVPKNDPTVLFTTAGMHPLVPYLLGEKHPLGKKLTSIQRCIRTQDIDEVGDTTHHTFFEMLGNWSLGDYFKEEAIEYSFKFLTEVLKIPKERLAVTVFIGDKDIPRDNESAKKWEFLGIKKPRIAFLGKENNWWGPAGKTGPCGPDTEIFYWKDNKNSAPEKFNPEDKTWVEIWNNVLMQYVQDSQGKYHESKQKNIDTGMGVERTTAVLNKLEDNYLADMWKPIIQEVEKVSKKDYLKSNESTKKSMRIIVDHIKASVFILGDKVIPSNTEQGYVLRRLIRRAIRHGKMLGIENFISNVAESVFVIYNDYEQLKQNKTKILEELRKEEEKFNETITKGIKIFEKILSEKKEIQGVDAFLLFQSYGFPLEMTFEMLNEKGVKYNESKIKKEFEKEQTVHQELSRTATEGKFKSGLADNSEKTKKFHTSTHILNEALRQILKDENVAQKGSNITEERLRFDFSFPRKLTEQEVKQVEDLVNEKIKQSLSVIKEEMPLKKAIESGAQAEFETKYPEIVSVYTIKDSSKKGWFSKEICTGPHVSNTKEIGKFKIIKEESSAAGIRRIKAVIEG
ncbi:MAG TPA: alanine--tRNA ligase [Candidatus Pacearchaeota archaeon]|nr:alanine--tRNA ligase [Candidatus Pacearchaeota archaeon]